MLINKVMIMIFKNLLIIWRIIRVMKIKKESIIMDLKRKIIKRQREISPFLSIPSFKERSNKDLENKKTTKIIAIQTTTIAIRAGKTFQETGIMEETHLLRIMLKLHNKN